jgi:predicted transcriptional regulator
MVRRTSAGEGSHYLILQILYNNQRLAFGQIVSLLKGQMSRGTINKYLGELFKEGLVAQEYGRPKYNYIPKESQKKVELFLEKEKSKKDYADVLDLSYEEMIKRLKELEKLLAVSDLSKEELKSKVSDMEKRLAFWDHPKVREFLERQLKKEKVQKDK